MLITLFIICINLANADNIYIFISFSMPENLLKEYIQESMKYPNSVLVLRGLINNNYTETAVKLNAINNYNGVKAIIDPDLFKQYNILHVPTIILEKSNNTFKKICGSVSIKYAMEIFDKEE